MDKAVNKQQLKAALAEKLAKMTPDQRKAALAKLAAKTARANSSGDVSTGDVSTGGVFTGEPAPVKPAPVNSGEKAQAASDYPSSDGVSNAQARLWVFESVQKNSTAYNIVSALHLSLKSSKGQIPSQNQGSGKNQSTLQTVISAIEWSVSQVVERHEILRTRFFDREGLLKTQIMPPEPVALALETRTEWQLASHETEIQQRIHAWSQSELDLQQPPLLKLKGILLGDGSLVLVMLMHHILADGWSLRLFEQELSECYKRYWNEIGNTSRNTNADPQQLSSSLAPLTLQYRHYVGWQQQFLDSPQAQQQLAYWQDQLSGAPSHIAFPVCMTEVCMAKVCMAEASNDLETMITRSHLFDFSAERIAAVESFAQAQRLSPFMVLLAAFKLVLSHYTGEQDLVIGTPVANRNQAEFTNNIGLFSNTVALRSQVLPQLALGDYLATIKHITLKGYANQALPFEKVVDAVATKRIDGQSPLFQVLFALQATESSELHLPDLTVNPIAMARHAMEFPLMAELFLTPERAFANFTYQVDVLSEPVVAALANLFDQVLNAIVQAPADTTLAALLSVSKVSGSIEDDSPTFESIFDTNVAFLQQQFDLDAVGDANKTCAVWIDPAIPVQTRLPLTEWLAASGATIVTGLATEASGTRWQFVSGSSWYAQHRFNGDFSQPVLINADSVNTDSVNTDQALSETDSLSQPSQLWILPQGLLFAFMNERKTRAETLSSPYPLFLRNPAKQALSLGLAGELMISSAFVAQPEPTGFYAVDTGSHALKQEQQQQEQQYQSRYQLVAATEHTEAVWVNQQLISLPQLRRSLVQLPNVADALLLVKTGQAIQAKTQNEVATSASHTRQLVAYVVPANNRAWSDIQAACQQQWQAQYAQGDESEIADINTGLNVVLVTGFEYLPNGQLDYHALQHLAVVDNHTQQQLNDAGVNWQQVPSEFSPWHVALNSAKAPIDKLDGESIESAAESGTESNGDSSIELAPDSICEGEALPSHLPTHVGKLLINAAQQYPEHGIGEIDGDSESKAASDAPAMPQQSHFLRYPDLLAQARIIAANLQRCGVGAGDVVMLQLQAPHHTLLGFWGCVLADAAVLMVEVPQDYQASTDSDLLRVQHALDGVAVKAVIAVQDRVSSFEQAFARSLDQKAAVLAIESLLQEDASDNLSTHSAHSTHSTGTLASKELAAKPDDPVLLMLTSGSTGKPKIVVQNHLAICSQAEGYSHGLQLNQQSRNFNWMPLHHVGAMVMSHTAFMHVGANQWHAVTEPFLQQPLRLLDVFSEYQITACWCPNFAFALINEALVNEALAADVSSEGRTENDKTENNARRWDLSHLQVLINAGEAVVQTTAAEFVERLAPFGLPTTVMCPVWGMSETSSGVLYHLNYNPFQAQRNNYVSVGQPIKGVAIRIVDQNDNPVPQGKSGRLQVQGNVVTKGYYNNPAVNQASYTADNWFNTGDLAVMHQAQNPDENKDENREKPALEIVPEIAIVGREKDLIIINGRNFHGLDIELCVETLPDVAESHCAACAVRLPQDNTDQLCIFYSRPTESLTHQHNSRHLSQQTEQRIRQITADELGVVPTYIICLPAEDMPRTSIGKIQRSLLANQFCDGQFQHLLADDSPASGDTSTASAQTLKQSNTVPQWFHQPKWLAQHRLNERDHSASNSTWWESLIWLAADATHAQNIAENFAQQVASETRNASEQNIPAMQSCDYDSLAETLAGALSKALSNALSKATGDKTNLQILLCDYLVDEDDQVQDQAQEKDQDQAQEKEQTEDKQQETVTAVWHNMQRLATTLQAVLDDLHKALEQDQAGKLPTITVSVITNQAYRSAVARSSKHSSSPVTAQPRINNPVLAGLNGLLSSLAIEHNLSVRQIHLLVSQPLSQSESHLAQELTQELTQELAQEIAAPVTDQQVLLQSLVKGSAQSSVQGSSYGLQRSVHRLVQRLVPVFNPNHHAAVALTSTSISSSISDSGDQPNIHVLLGGLGGIGLQLSRYLLQQNPAPNACHIVAVGRRSLEQVLAETDLLRDSQSSYQQLKAEFANFHYFQGDLSRSASIKALFNEIERELDGSLSTVYHLLGAETPLAIASLNSEQAAQQAQGVFAPKVQCSVALTQALQARPEVSLIHFSSVAGLLGGKHYGAYALANGFQTAWCQLQSEQRISARTSASNHHCVLWSMWQGTGMALQPADDTLDPQQATENREAALRHSGYHVLSVSEALNSFAVALQSDVTNKATGSYFGAIGIHSGAISICIGLNDHNPHMFRHGMRVGQAAAMLQLDDAEFTDNAQFENALSSSLPQHDSFGTPLLYQHTHAAQSQQQDLSDDADYLALQAIWQKVLNQPSVSPQDNFFALGGDSILAIQCVSQAAQAGLALQPKDFFQAQTLSQLVACCKQGKQRVKAEKLHGELPLMPMQQWFFEQQFAAPEHFNQSALLTLNLPSEQPFHLPALEQALAHVTAQHDLLRAQFKQGTHEQQILDQIHIPVEQVALDSVASIFALCQPVQSGLGFAQAATTNIKNSANNSAENASENQPEPSLIRVLHLQADDPSASRLLIAVHHLLIDGVSWRIVLEDIERCYCHFSHSFYRSDSARENQPNASKPPELIGSSNVKQWQTAVQYYLQSELARDDFAFWQQADSTRQSHDFVALTIQEPNQQPTQEPETEQTRSQSNLREHETHLDVSLSGDITQRLFQDLPYQQSLKPDDIIIAALTCAYRQCFGGDGLSLLMEGHGRELPLSHGALENDSLQNNALENSALENSELDLSRTVGWFTAFYPLHVLGVNEDSSSSSTEQAALAAQILATAQQRERIPDGGVSFNLLKYLTSRDTQTAMATLAIPQVSYNYLGRFDMGGDTLFQFASEAPGDQVSPTQQRPNELDIVGRILNDEAVFSFIFSAKRYQQADIQRWVSAFEQALFAITGIADEQWQQARLACPPKVSNQVSNQGLNQVSGQLPSSALEQVLPAAAVQTGVLFEALVNRIDGVYVSQLINHISGDLHVEHLRLAWQQVIDQYAIYRTGFIATEQGEYLQLVHKQCELPFIYEDWRTLPAAAQERQYQEWLATDRQTGFDFATPPLLRIHLVRLAERQYRLLLSEFHAVADGWSRGVVLNTVVQAYRSLQQGRSLPAHAPEVTPNAKPMANVQFHDYQHWFARQDMAPAKAFWSQQPLSDIQAVPLCFQQQSQKEPNQKEQGSTTAQSLSLSHVFNQETSNAVHQGAKDCRVTLNALMQSAWQILLRLYTTASTDDSNLACQLAFGMTHSGRGQSGRALSGDSNHFHGIEHVVGPLINTLPVAVLVEPAQTVRAKLQQAQQHISELTDNGALPLNDIAQLHGKPQLADALSTLFVFENFPMTAPEPDEQGLTIDEVISIDSTEYPLTLSVIPEQPITLQLYYLDSHFHASDIATIAQHVERLALAMAQHPDCAIGELNWLSADERDAIQQRLVAMQFSSSESSTSHSNTNDGNTSSLTPAEQASDTAANADPAELADVEDLEF